MTSEKFIETVRTSLIETGVDFEALKVSGKGMGLGISGGADSVSLFLALKEILSEWKIPLVCVTVNHHIRKADETNGDMEFVKDLVEKAGSENIFLDVYDLPEGKIGEVENERKCGTEEAARFVRYRCFEESVKKHNLAFFALAHNQNDNLETILMRFLQGSSVIGIRTKRDFYVRPLLGISRKEIEAFLEEKGQLYRTDSTNSDAKYFRNNVRLNLIPLLDERFPLWRENVLSAAERSLKEYENSEQIIEKKYKLFAEEKKSGEKTVSILLKRELFSELPGETDRIILKAFNRLGEAGRIPSVFISDVEREMAKTLESGKGFSKRFAQYLCEGSSEGLLVKSYAKKQTDSGFFDIIEEEGDYSFPFGSLSVRKTDGGIIVQGESCRCETFAVDFPFVIRSPALGEKKKLFVIEG